LGAKTHSKSVLLEGTMSDETQKEATANAKLSEELPTEELSNISGGVVKQVDKPSPKLFLACASGEHYPTK
jgi:bacteriocin-like protein